MGVRPSTLLRISAQNISRKFRGKNIKEKPWLTPCGDSVSPIHETECWTLHFRRMPN